MDQRDDLGKLITKKISSLSEGIDEKVLNATLQAKVVSDLSSAVRVHLQKILEITSSNAEPDAIIAAVKSSVQNLATALQNEESRTTANCQNLQARKAILQEVSSVVEEQIDVHESWLQKKSEIQERHLSGENVKKTKPGQRPESLRDVRNALAELNEDPPKEEPTPAPQQDNPHEPLPVNDEQPLDDVSFKNHIQTQEETTNSSQDEQEPPQHVSRFFSGE